MENSRVIKDQPPCSSNPYNQPSTSNNSSGVEPRIPRDSDPSSPRHKQTLRTLDNMTIRCAQAKSALHQDSELSENTASDPVVEGPLIEGTLRPYHSTIPDNDLVSDLFKIAEEQYSQLKTISDFTDLPQQDPKHCKDTLNTLITTLEQHYELIVETLHNLELGYPLHQFPESDFSTVTSKRFHQLFSTLLDAYLLRIQLTLEVESITCANSRSYESAFTDLGSRIKTMKTSLSTRLNSYLVDYSIQDKTRQSALQSALNNELNRLRNHLNPPSDSAEIKTSNNPEVNNAIRLLNRYDPDKEYTLNQYNRFRLLAERLLLDSYRMGEFRIHEGLLSAQGKTLDNIERFINREDKTSRIFAKTQKSIDKIEQMLVIAFLKLRGKPTDSAAKSPHLLCYLNGIASDLDTLREGLIELTNTRYWECNCGKEFKVRINTALSTPLKLKEFKDYLDSCIIKENLGFINNTSNPKEFYVVRLISEFKGHHIAYGNPYREVIEMLSCIPSRCDEMLNHIFGTCKSLINDYPEKHQDFQKGHVFSVLQALDAAASGLSDIEMKFDHNGEIYLDIHLMNGNSEIIKTAIINPDGLPYTPSPLNPVQVIFGPIKTVPLAIELKSKAVTYDSTTGYHKSTYASREQLVEQHNEGHCLNIRAKRETLSIKHNLNHCPYPDVPAMYLMYQREKSNNSSLVAMKPLPIKGAAEMHGGDEMLFTEDHFA